MRGEITGSPARGGGAWEPRAAGRQVGELCHQPSCAAHMGGGGGGGGRRRHHKRKGICANRCQAYWINGILNIVNKAARGAGKGEGEGKKNERAPAGKKGLRVALNRTSLTEGEIPSSCRDGKKKLSLEKREKESCRSRGSLRRVTKRYPAY